MALWLVRTGKHGEHEQKFLDDNRVYITWSGLRHDLSTLADKNALKAVLRKTYPDLSKKAIGGSAGQIGIIWREMKPGDWVIVPSKRQPAVHVAEIESDYKYDESGDDSYRHYRDIRWIKQDIPTSNFDRDIARSMNALLTVCGIKRSDAERKVRGMAKSGWGITPAAGIHSKGDVIEGTDGDPELSARTEIAKFINARFDAHEFEDLVRAILAAKGMSTHQTPKGPDQGIDVLAAPGILGFGDPKIVVQVKMWSNAADESVLTKLMKTMKLVGADHGLLVSWSGYCSAIEKERAKKFFSVRLWNQTDVLDELFANYEQLDVTLRSKLPLKRVWTLATAEDGT
jgi:restriction system protein